MDQVELLDIKTDFNEIDKLYDECLNYLKLTRNKASTLSTKLNENNAYDSLKNVDDDIADANIDKSNLLDERSESFVYEKPKTDFKIENERESLKDTDSKKSTDTTNIELLPKPVINVIKYEKEQNKSTESFQTETKSERLRRLSQQLPRIIITQSNTSLNAKKELVLKNDEKKNRNHMNGSRPPPLRMRSGYGDYPRRLVSKNGVENVALISNVPFEKIRLLNDTFHTLINLRWRWIVSGTIVLHFTIWLVFAVFWYITALAHYDFEPDPPKRACVTGGKDFVTIFLASVEAQTTIGFGDRTIDEECPESIFLFVMQLILGTGLSGVLTCVVYAKLTRPEKLSRDGVGFSKKAVISIRDGKLCLMMRAWDLNYDHIISSDFSAHFVKTHRSKEGEVIRHYARSLELQQRQFLLWPLTLVHVIDQASPLYDMAPHHFATSSFEITVSLKGASASMGTFTQSQTSYLPKEISWGYRFPPVVRYDHRKQKYVIDQKKLDLIEQVETPLCSARLLYSSTQEQPPSSPRPGTPSSFSEKISTFKLERSSSFRKSGSKTPEDKNGAPFRPGTPGDFNEKITAFQLERSSSFRRMNESSA